MSNLIESIRELKEFFGDEYANMMQAFQSETEDICSKLIDLFSENDHYPSAEELEQYMRLLHTLKGISAQNNLAEVADWVHKIEDLFVAIKAGQQEFVLGSFQSIVPFFIHLDRLVLAVCTAKDEDTILAKLSLCRHNFRIFYRLYEEFFRGQEDQPPASQNQGTPQLQRMGSPDRVRNYSIRKKIEHILHADQTASANQAEQTPQNVDEDRHYSVGEKDIDQLADGLCLSLFRIPEDDGRSEGLNLLRDELTQSVVFLFQVRMVNAQALVRKAEKVAKDTANRLGKKVSLVCKGFEEDIDTAWFYTLSEALVHMVRNSIDHGIEHPDQRTKLSKNPTAQLSVTLSTEGPICKLSVADDGKGIDGEIVAKKALAKGVVTAGELQTMTLYDKQSLVFRPGFSTQDQVSEVSGRGVGMDVVKRSVEAKGGLLSFDSEKGRGTEFTIAFAVKHFEQRVLVFSYSGEKFALPTTIIHSIVERGHRRTVEFGALTTPDGDMHTIIHLAQIDPLRPDFRERPYLLLTLAGAPCALGVDDIVGERELMFFTFAQRKEALPYINSFSNSSSHGRVARLSVLELEAGFNHYLLDEEKHLDSHDASSPEWNAAPLKFNEPHEPHEPSRQPQSQASSATDVNPLFTAILNDDAFILQLITDLETHYTKPSPAFSKAVERAAALLDDLRVRLGQKSVLDALTEMMGEHKLDQDNTSILEIIAHRLLSEAQAAA